MPHDKKLQQCSHDKGLKHGHEPQGQEAAQVSQAVEETLSSPNPVMPSNMQMASVAQAPGNPGGPSGIHAACGGECDDSSSSEDESNPSTLEGLLDKKVSFLMNLMLLHYQRKEPITKADMVKFVIREHEALYSAILKKACLRLEVIFGLEVKEMDATNHCFGIFIKQGFTYDGMQCGEVDIPKTGLLIFVLGVIFMKGHRATEEHIWEEMKEAEICCRKKHFIFGDPKQLFTIEFVKEGYLKYQKGPDSDPEKYELLWGPRAYAETTKMKVLEFMAKVHGTDPTDFPSLYEEAQLEEQERALSRMSVSAASSSMGTESSGGMTGK
ncbi:melanoma-associated antigen B16-like [Perognathus longimembris pacificus]|uniref:melanoma-associated antigen B16-like n=1 Tax=Perognathus longimembris pacificus TaxID=214514 RepID=UPI00201A17C3|nr:melanoma-associated antigen B16-like [Perognathus longimembris pacificus]